MFPGSWGEPLSDFVAVNQPNQEQCLDAPTEPRSANEIEFARLILSNVSE